MSNPLRTFKESYLDPCMFCKRPRWLCKLRYFLGMSI